MRALVTGATGLIGNILVKRLLLEGHTVMALVRDPIKAARILPKEVQLVGGDICAVIPPEKFAEIDWLFHAAGMPEQWVHDEKIFDLVNREGTRNVLEAAQIAGVKRFIHISTMDVFEAPSGGVVVETRIDSNPKFTAYERSKQNAEKEAEKYLKLGMNIVFANPSAVYGPSPVHIALNSFFIKLLNREAPLLPPGGTSVVFTEGLAEGLVRLAEKGRSGERYLFSDAHFSTRELAEATVRVAGFGNVPLVAPSWLMGPFSKMAGFVASITKKAPIVAPTQFEFLQWNVNVDASKAIRDLGFYQTPIEQGLAVTIKSLKDEKLIRI